MAQLNDLLVMGQSTLLGPLTAWDKVGIGTNTPAYKLHVTGDIYANGGYFKVSGDNGLHFTSYGSYLVPNTVSTHGSLRVYGGAKGGYEGIHFGSNKTGMTVMSIDASHQGLYTEEGNGWIIYNNAANSTTSFGIGTSDLTSEYKITLGGSTSVKGELKLNNNNITDVNSFQFADPGVSEGITWTGGNGWWIYESPDGLTNDKGNLQFVHGSTRRLTIRTDGYVDVNAHLLADDGLTWKNAYWTAPGNIICNKNDNGSEFSFDMGAGTQWHVWSTVATAGSMLSCFADTKWVQVHNHLQVGSYVNASYALTTDSFITSDWVRTDGNNGWFNEKYKGGWWMTDETYIRAYNGKAVYVENSGQHAIYTAGGFASSKTEGIVFSTYHNGTWYSTLRTHGNGNLTVDAPGGNVYLAYYNGNIYIAQSGAYIDRNAVFTNGTIASSRIGDSYVKARESALIKTTTSSTSSKYMSLVSGKTQQGEFSYGVIHPYEQMEWVYTDDDGYAANSNTGLNSDNTAGGYRRVLAVNNFGLVTAVSYNATSDKRLKENLSIFKPQKSILDLPIYKFDFINGAKNQIGCMAQDLQEICPEVVTEDRDGYLSISESKIIYLLIDEVKKLKSDIAVLKGA